MPAATFTPDQHFCSQLLDLFSNITAQLSVLPFDYRVILLRYDEKKHADRTKYV